MKIKEEILTAIILIYHDEKYLAKCVSSLRSSAKKINLHLQIIIVINDISLQKTKFHFPPKCDLIFNPINLGFGKSINNATKKAVGKWLLIVNSDTVTKSDALEYLYKMTDDKRVGIVAPKILNPDGSLQSSISDIPTLWNLFKEQSYFYKFLPRIFQSQRTNKILYGYKHEVDVIMGAYFIIKKRLFDNVGGFDERFFIYFEDFDLCLQVKKLGYKIIFNPNSQIIHFGQQSFLGSQRGDYYLISLYQFLSKYHNKFYALLGIYIVLIGCCLRYIFWNVRIKTIDDEKSIVFGKKKLGFIKQYISEFIKLSLFD